jgi:hypothetical protein
MAHLIAWFRKGWSTVALGKPVHRVPTLCVSGAQETGSTCVGGLLVGQRWVWLEGPVPSNSGWRIQMPTVDAGCQQPCPRIHLNTAVFVVSCLILHVSQGGKNGVLFIVATAIP